VTTLPAHLAATVADVRLAAQRLERRRHRRRAATLAFALALVGALGVGVASAGITGNALTLVDRGVHFRFAGQAGPPLDYPRYVACRTSTRDRWVCSTRGQGASYVLLATVTRSSKPKIRILGGGRTDIPKTVARARPPVLVCQGTAAHLQCRPGVLGATATREQALYLRMSR
jgi:hypothetical protein